MRVMTRSHTVDAVQYLGLTPEGHMHFSEGCAWLNEAVASGVVRRAGEFTDMISITALSGESTFLPTDWVLRLHDGGITGVAAEAFAYHYVLPPEPQV